jgi:ADP-heptose:LPS heptosyltransferase
VKIQTLRRLDRWLGGLACRLIARLSRTGPRRNISAQAPRVLCIGLAEMGSMVLAAPALRTLAARGVELHFLTFAQHRPVPRLAGIAAEANIHVLRCDSLWTLGRDLLGFLAASRRIAPEAVIDLDPCMNFSTLLGWASGAPLRAGFTHAGPAWQARNALHTLPVPYTDAHMAEQFAALVARLDGVLTLSRPAGAVLAEASREHIPARQRIVFLNPNAGDAIPQRRWPLERFAELGERLLDTHPDLRIALIGSADDRPACAVIAERLPRLRCTNLAGELPLEQLPQLFAGGELLVSNDSGPAHLATLAGLPVVTLFGPETPQRYRPLGRGQALYAALPCSPCITPDSLRSTRCADNRCLQAITVDAVFAAAHDLLTRQHDAGQKRIGIAA